MTLFAHATAARRAFDAATLPELASPMQKIVSRGVFFLPLVGLVILATSPLAQAAAETETRLAELEKIAGGRLGVYALDTGSGREITHRADERFPMCSTFKALLVAAVLQRSTEDRDLIAKQIAYAKSDLVTYSPITEKHDKLSVAELCAAAIQYSDNTAANLLIRLLGEPGDVTAYARKIGNETFRLDRLETDLNTAVPSDPRDTVTPRGMGRSLQAVTLTPSRRLSASSSSTGCAGIRPEPNAFALAPPPAGRWAIRRAPVVTAPAMTSPFSGRLTAPPSSSPSITPTIKWRPNGTTTSMLLLPAS